MRVAVVDIGSNSTRLLVADIDSGTGTIEEIERRSTVTRLGQGVDSTGELVTEAMDRVFAALAGYRASIDTLGATTAVAVLTSAVRDAANGARFTQAVRDDFGLDASTLSGDEEAQLTFLGATSERPYHVPAPVVVIDIGGGSTEFVVGARGHVAFHVSTQAGVVRHAERHVHSDPPDPGQLEALATDARRVFDEATRGRYARAGIAVAGTATTAAAIDLGLDPYDPTKVHGHRLTRARVQEIRDRLSAMAEGERRSVPGLDPARAPTIVPGTILLLEAMRAFELEEVEVSEHDILRGVALRAAGWTDV